MRSTWWLGCRRWGVGSGISEVCVVRGGWDVGGGVWEVGNGVWYVVRGTWYVVRSGQFESTALCALARYEVSTSYELQATSRILVLPPPAGEVAAGRRGVVRQEVGCRV